jgi:HlyD family secretion protein
MLSTNAQRALIVLLLAVGCAKPVPAPVYQAIPVERRDIVVSAQASGSVQPDTTVQVKSKASGEILQILVETGQLVQRGQLMVQIDKRQPKNDVDQAQANLDVAKATLTHAQAQLGRAEELYKTRSIAETDYEQAGLDFSNAKSAVISATVNLENAKIALEDCEIRAPITGTIIEKDVERGQVISSPTRDVGGGTVLLQMADLNLVQVKTLVDETDIGKIQSGQQATVTVNAYPNRPFTGTVRKVEPQSTTQNNVTMFSVIVQIANREGLLLPGMNTDVEVHVGRRDSVLAVPNAALRTNKDVASAAAVLGLQPADVQAQLATMPTPGDTATHVTVGAKPADPKAAAANTMTTPDGRTVTLPPGVTEERVRAIFAKFRSGGEPTAEDRAIMQQMRSLNGGGNGGGRRAGGQASQDTRLGGNYIVFVQRGGQPVPVKVRTGITDLDYSEVVAGLTERDSVLILPSASLVQSQADLKERVNRMTGGGIPGMKASTSTAAPARP